MRTSAIVLLLALSAAPGCGRRCEDAASGGASPCGVRLGLATQPASALLLVAVGGGLLEAQGLRATVIPYLSGKRALEEGLASNVVDMANTSDICAALVAFERRDLRILCTLGSAVARHDIVARRDRGILTPADLRGKRIATQKASSVHYFLSQFLTAQGIGGRDATVVFMRAEDLVGALTAGSVDAICMREPFTSQARARLRDRAVVFSEPDIYVQADVLMASQAYVRANPRGAAAMIRALVEAQRICIEHPATAIGVAADRLGISREDTAQLWPTLRLHPSLEQSLLWNLEDRAHWAVSEGLVRTNAIPNYLRVLDAAPLAGVKPQAVSVIR